MTDTKRLTDAEFEARGLARSRYHDKLFVAGAPRPTNDQFDEGWEAARKFYAQNEKDDIPRECPGCVCGNCRAWRRMTNDQGFTADDKAKQPQSLTALESCIRAAIFNVLDSKTWLLYEQVDRDSGRAEPKILWNEAQVNAERADLADAVIVRLRSRQPERPKKIEYTRPPFDFEDSNANMRAVAEELKREETERVSTAIREGQRDADQRTQVSAEDARTAHLAAAEAWNHVAEYRGKCADAEAWRIHLLYCPFCQELLRNACDATRRANKSTKAAPANVQAPSTHAVSAALLAATIPVVYRRYLPVEAVAAHRRAATAYAEVDLGQRVDEALAGLLSKIPEREVR